MQEYCSSAGVVNIFKKMKWGKKYAKKDPKTGRFVNPVTGQVSPGAVAIRRSSRSTLVGDRVSTTGRDDAKEEIEKNYKEQLEANYGKKIRTKRS